MENDRSHLVIHDDGLLVTPNVGRLPVCGGGSFPAVLEFKVSYPGQVDVEIQYSIARFKKAYFSEKGSIVKQLHDRAAVSERPSVIKRDIRLCLADAIPEERVIITLEIKVAGQEASRRSRCSFNHLQIK
jgi:hypothetical protein